MVFFKHIKYFFLILLFCQTALAVNYTPEEQEGIRLFNEGLKLANGKMFEDSINSFNLAIQKFPKLMRAYYRKSQVLATLGRHEESLKACDDALELKKEQPIILAQKALCLYALQKYKESLETAQLAVQHGNDLPIAYFARANAYATLGNYEIAVSDYNRALELVTDHGNPALAETYLNRFCPLYNLKRYEEALETCNKALKITDNPNKLPQIYSKKAAALNKLGRYEEALENANKALKISAKDSLALSEKQLAIAKLKQKEI